MTNNILKTTGILGCAVIAPFASAAACDQPTYKDLTNISIADSTTHVVVGSGRTKSLGAQKGIRPEGRAAFDKAGKLGTDKIVLIQSGEFTMENATDGKCLNTPVNVRFQGDHQAIIMISKDKTVRTLLFDFNGDAPNGPCPRFPMSKPTFKFKGHNIIGNASGVENYIKRADAVAMKRAGCGAIDFAKGYGSNR